MELRKVGGLIRLDADGHVVNEARHDAICEPWSDAVAFLQDCYLRELGEAVHGVYVRGSVARGLAIAGISDVDTFAMVHGRAEAAPEMPATLKQLRRQIAPEFARRFPFAIHGELDVGFRQDVVDGLGQGAGIEIKTQSVCVHGTDLAPQIPPFSFARFAYVHERAVREVPFDEVLRGYAAARPEQRFRWCGWGKRLLRWGMWLTMARAATCSRDLYFCCELFGECYPQWAAPMRAVLEATLEPPDDFERGRRLFADVTVFLRDEVARLPPPRATLPP